MTYKRKKEIDSVTLNIKTNCGTLNLIKGFEEKKLVEIYAVVGRSGTCANILLDSFCKVLSMYLQTTHPRYKIVKKLKKQFIEANCGIPFTYDGKQYKSCIDFIAQNIQNELE